MLSLVGKSFPTTKETEEEQKKERVQTASFITQSALGGLKVASIFDAKLLNAPEIYPFASLQGFLRLALTLLAFRTVDSHKTDANCTKSPRPARFEAAREISSLHAPRAEA